MKLNKTLGQIAYEAYSAAYMVAAEWHKVEPKKQAAWQAAAKAIQDDLYRKRIKKKEYQKPVE